MEKYYLPLSIYPEINDEFSIEWVNTNYRVYSICPQPTPETVSYYEIQPWGHVVGIGQSVISNSSSLILGTGCSGDFTNEIGRAQISRSIFDAPNFSPFEPIYFFIFLVFFIWLIKFITSTLFGKNYR